MYCTVVEVVGPVTTVVDATVVLAVVVLAEVPAVVD